MQQKQGMELELKHKNMGWLLMSLKDQLKSSIKFWWGNDHGRDWKFKQFPLSFTFWMWDWHHSWSAGMRAKRLACTWLSGACGLVDCRSGSPKCCLETVPPTETGTPTALKLLKIRAGQKALSLIPNSAETFLSTFYSQASKLLAELCQRSWETHYS